MALFKCPKRRTHPLPFGFYAKYGPFISKSEALATTYIGTWTTIPVPKIRDCIEYDGGTFILMTKLPGKPVRGDLKMMSKHELDAFVETLNDWMNQLRALGAPSNAVSHFDGGACSAKRIYEDKTCGPFTSVKEFHEYLYYTIHDPEDRARLRQLAQHKSHNRQHRICFTHGDLDPSNLLILDNRLTGLVDFGDAGWYPEYWDFTTALFGRGYGQERGYHAWINAWECVFPQYHDEIQVEKEFWRVSYPY